MTAKSTPKHPFQVMPDLSADEYADLRTDIKKRGVMVPVEYDEHGNVLDGHHRVRICKEIGIKDFPKIIRKGLDEAGKRSHARALNLMRRHLDAADRRKLIEDQLRDTPEASNRKIAAALGVDHKTVGTVRTAAQSTGEIPQLKKTVGADGKSRPTKQPSNKQSTKSVEPVSTAKTEPVGSPPVRNSEVAATSATPQKAAGTGSGESTTSAVNVAHRLLVELVANGANKVKSGSMAQRMHSERAWSIDIVTKLRSWLTEIEAALTIERVAP
jgi:hypothetical protein